MGHLREGGDFVETVVFAAGVIWQMSTVVRDSDCAFAVGGQRNRPFILHEEGVICQMSITAVFR